MTPSEFENFVMAHGKDILRFCRLSVGNNDIGDELYQDAMLKLLEKMHRLDAAQNLKSYALSVCMGTLGIVSPVLASKIPLIGHIFERTQDNLT